MNIKQTLTYVCHQCGATETTSDFASLDTWVMKPVLPNGWVRVGKLIFCQRHNVTPDVDGKVYYIAHPQNDSRKKLMMSAMK